MSVGTVYLLVSNWMCNGNNSVNDIIGVYDSLAKAQKAMVEDIDHVLQYHRYEHMETDSPDDLSKTDFHQLANMFHDDPNFSFDAAYVRLYNGKDDELCEDYQRYNIEEFEVM